MARIRSRVRYDPETGLLHWLGLGKAVRGAVASRFHKSTGYMIINFGKASYQAHSVAWMLTHGRWPVDMIDHINRVKTDNRLENLREATKSQNMSNAKKHIHVKREMGSRLKGAYPVPNSPKFKAQVNHNNIRYYLGRFDTEEEAHAAYRAKAAELHREFAAFE